ncbi:hypothetical protein KIN20_005125 [Parelaphostrongylus tenuis]|uniref:Uncharacterized protein n=1 Tax=Parelaphostrongylus tenuis TaxID=148309 RepID=A0AAD5MHW7_PARTN|nr:hypothetical protein KIN20_005125 [Parelaphostrongylus tenuis]
MTVTGVCATTEMNGFPPCNGDMVTLTPVPAQSHDDIRNSVDYKHHHGELEQDYVAKCSEQSGTNVGI